MISFRVKQCLAILSFVCFLPNMALAIMTAEVEGFTFGTPIEQALALAKKKGFTLQQVENLDSETKLYIMSGTAHGIENSRFDLMEREKVVTHIMLEMQPKTEKEKKTVLEVYDKYRKMWLEKYGEPNEEMYELSWFFDEGKAGLTLLDDTSAVAITAFLF